MILSFSEASFVPLIQSGKKNQTIRRNRHARWKVGMTADLYHGFTRSRNAVKLGTAKIVYVVPIEIRYASGMIYVDGRLLDRHAREVFAASDGFDSGDAMVAWFLEQYKKHDGRRFTGSVIRWEKFKAVPK